MQDGTGKMLISTIWDKQSKGLIVLQQRLQ